MGLWASSPQGLGFRVQFRVSSFSLKSRVEGLVFKIKVPSLRLQVSGLGPRVWVSSTSPIDRSRV